jgi:hypothetical protein
MLLAVAVSAVATAAMPPTHVFGQAEMRGQSSIQGENFSAKPAPALFASDCTGAGCHKGPQGLGKRLGLASFLREHYTNSRESAAALANYLASLPAPADRTPPGQRSRRATEAPEPPDTVPPARGRRTSEPAADTAPKPAPTRGQRGRQATAAPIPPPEPADVPAETEAAPTPPPAQVFDIFD